MLELTSAGRPVHLSPGTSVQLEYNSPLFDEDTMLGTFSYSFNVPAPPNGPLYGFPERPDAAAQPGAQLPAELSEGGIPLLVGTQRVRSASARQYSVSVGGGLSGAGLSERTLASFAYGGLREVPRWVPIDPTGPQLLAMPGLTRHANDVVASPQDYDYIFAPLRNEYLFPAQVLPVTPDPLQQPRNTVNRWLVFPVPVLGMVAGGSFTYNLDIGVPAGVVLEKFEPLPPYCPFPFLRYVLQAIVEECGLVVDPANWLPGELGSLVMAGNAQLVDRGDVDTLRFALADVLPEMTVAELLATLRQDLGVAVYVDQASGRVRTAYLVERVAADAAYLDLSALVAGSAEVTIDTSAGLTLTYGVDGNDELSKDLLTLQPAAALILPAVATVAALPARALLADGPKAGQVRLVQDRDTYYSCVVSAYSTTEVNLTWTPLVVRLPSVPVNGGGEEKAQRLCYTPLLPTVLADPSGTADLPAISQPPYRAGLEDVERSPALRLFFYNGLQLASDGVSTYPQLSSRSATGALSLHLSGPQGTYAQLLAPWLAVKLRGASYKVPLALRALDLVGLDWGVPVRLAGVRYLVRKLTATAPLRKPATVELARL